jgi:hypothetical protein
LWYVQWIAVCGIPEEGKLGLGLVETKIAPGPDWWNLLASLSREGR